MTRKEQNKILDAKIESNVNQYKVDRLNAEILAFSSGDLAGGIISRVPRVLGAPRAPRGSDDDDDDDDDDEQKRLSKLLGELRMMKIMKKLETNQKKIK